VSSPPKSGNLGNQKKTNEIKTGAKWQSSFAPQTKIETAKELSPANQPGFLFASEVQT
jgi:hypothetical protein